MKWISFQEAQKLQAARWRGFRMIWQGAREGLAAAG